MSSRTQRAAQPGPYACPHKPPCPPATARDRQAAHAIISHPEQGWSLLCNGVVVYADTGDMLPGGAVHGPHRAAAPDRKAWLRAERLAAAAAGSGRRGRD
jgi:hypothetical protein